MEHTKQILAWFAERHGDSIEDQNLLNAMLREFELEPDYWANQPLSKLEDYVLGK